MPGPAAHLTIVEKQVAKLAQDPKFKPVGPALGKHPSHAALGSIGPDMLFWADWGEFTPFVNTVFDIYATLDEVFDKLMAIWKPIQDVIDKVVNALTGGLAAELEETANLVKGIIDGAFLKLLTDQLNYYAILKPAFQKANAPETGWNWLDFTHHRRTGQFSRALIANASTDPQRAYALGWLSHVTADVVGHAYVNQAVGGPWRTHYQRHHIQENFMDAWVWGFYHTPGVAMPAAPPPPGTIPFDYPKFANVNTANLHKVIDLGGDLPADLQKLIADTLAQVYKTTDPTTGQPEYPTVISFLGPNEVNRAYKMLRKAFEVMTGKDRYLPPPTAPSVLNDDAPPTYPSPSGGGSGGGGGGGGGGAFSLLALLAAIWDAIKNLFTYVFDLILWLISQVTFPLTYPVRYALYLVQLGLYSIYQHFRWALTLSGYVYPEPHRLGHAMAQQFINPEGIVSNYPHLEWPPYVLSKGEQEHCLFYPSNPAEPPPTSPGPYRHWPLNYPFWFVEGEPYDPDVEARLINARTPEETARITSGSRRGLGNAVDLFGRRVAELIGGGPAKMQLPDWNMDADRGYGFKCWRIKSGTTLQPPNYPPAAGWTTSIEYL
jgi:hypothetical protein